MMKSKFWKRWTNSGDAVGVSNIQAGNIVLSYGVLPSLPGGFDANESAVLLGIYALCSQDITEAAKHALRTQTELHPWLTNPPRAAVPKPDVSEKDRTLSVRTLET